MGALISTLIIIVGILLIIVVLVQNSKGGGLSSTFAGSNQVMGVRKTADFLEKATWTLAIALLVLSLAAAPYSKTGGTEETTAVESVSKKKASENALAPVAAPQGMPAPVQQQPPVTPNPEPAPTTPAPAGK